jgi:hypothetical protein
LRLLWRLLPEYLFCSPTKDKAVLAANEQLLASYVVGTVRPYHQVSN